MIRTAFYAFHNRIVRKYGANRPRRGKYPAMCYYGYRIPGQGIFVYGHRLIKQVLIRANRFLHWHYPITVNLSNKRLDFDTHRIYQRNVQQIQRELGRSGEPAKKPGKFDTLLFGLERMYHRHSPALEKLWDTPFTDETGATIEAYFKIHASAMGSAPFVLGDILGGRQPEPDCASLNLRHLGDRQPNLGDRQKNVLGDRQPNLGDGQAIEREKRANLVNGISAIVERRNNYFLKGIFKPVCRHQMLSPLTTGAICILNPSKLSDWSKNIDGNKCNSSYKSYMSYMSYRSYESNRASQSDFPAEAGTEPLETLKKDGTPQQTGNPVQFEYFVPGRNVSIETETMKKNTRCEQTEYREESTVTTGKAPKNDECIEGFGRHDIREHTNAEITRISERVYRKLEDRLRQEREMRGW